MKKISIIESKDNVGKEVTIGAWVANKRSSGKIAFLQLRDGSGFFQGIVVKSEVGDEIFQLANDWVRIGITANIYLAYRCYTRR